MKTIKYLFLYIIAAAIAVTSLEAEHGWTARETEVYNRFITNTKLYKNPRNQTDAIADKIANDFIPAFKAATANNKAQAFCTAAEDIFADETFRENFTNEEQTAIHAVCTGNGLNVTPSYWTKTGSIDPKLSASTRALNSDKKTLLIAARTASASTRTDACKKVGLTWSGVRTATGFEPGDPDSGELIPIIGCLACRSELMKGTKKSDRHPNICGKLCGELPEGSVCKSSK